MRKDEDLGKRSYEDHQLSEVYPWKTPFFIEKSQDWPDYRLLNRKYPEHQSLSIPL